MKHAVNYSKTLGVDLQAAWSVLRDFGSIIHWVTEGDAGSISTSGSGIGMTRDLTLPSVGDVQHRLDALDETNHLITYSLSKGQPIGMKDYCVSISLDRSSDSCDIKWEGVFDAVAGADAEDVALRLKAAFETMTLLFERYVNRTALKQGF